MKICISTLAATALVASVAFAQTPTANADAERPATPKPTGNFISQTVRGAAPDTLRIFAAMVEFQTDDDRSTVGDGTFGSIYSEDYGDEILDPLPHDREYFETKLEFAKRYIERVSGGKTIVEYYVAPNVATVSERMREYAPPIATNDFAPLADFVSESWTVVDQANPGADFASYDLFAIFHAGVSRSVTLPGSLGNERDLPSIYFSLEKLREYFGESYAGVEVKGGAFAIPNTAVLPQTENRELESFGEKYLFELTTNGLIVSTICSHFGLPDLFDVNTGLSAIGRMGLMDGQGIFAYLGALPPAPSAWERVFLGWEEPTVVSPLSGKVELEVAARRAAEDGDETVYKIPINETEYYLIENRRRDVNQDGARVLVRNGDREYWKTFAEDEDGFRSYDIDSLEGVILDVDEFDWALPGEGILIWHIDEETISATLDANEVNADKYRRGVDVEEADGVQDIGEEFTTIFGDVVVGEGYYWDFWYADNDAPLYENRFDADSRPNTNDNDDARSLLSFTNFSAIGDHMTVELEFGDEEIAPVASMRLASDFEGETFFSATGSADDARFVGVVKKNLYSLRRDGTVAFSKTGFSEQTLAAFESAAIDYYVGSFPNRVNVFRHGVVADVDRLLLEDLVPDGANDEILTAPVVAAGETTPVAYLGLASGRVVAIKLGDVSRAPATDTLYDLSHRGKPAQLLIADGELVAAIQSDGGYYLAAFDGRETFADGEIIRAAATKTSAGETAIVALVDGNRFDVWTLAADGFEAFATFDARGENVERFSIADLRNDGENYVVAPVGGAIHAFTLAGAEAEGFPFEDERSVGFSAQIASADFTGDGASELIAATIDGRIFAINSSGRVARGFPISIGEPTGGALAAISSGDSTLLIGASRLGSARVWKISDRSAVLDWNGEYGDAANGSFTAAAGASRYETTFFPEAKAYNYPNPVYGDQTYIRYYVAKDADVTVRVFDLAGDYVAELSGRGIGGVENEIVWRIGDVESGVYLAALEVRADDGTTASKIIKIAIVK